MMGRSDVFLYRCARVGSGQRRKRVMVYRAHALGCEACAVCCQSLCEEWSRSDRLTRTSRSWLWALDVMSRRYEQQVNL